MKKNVFGQDSTELGFDDDKPKFELIIDKAQKPSDVLLISFVGAAGAFAAVPIPEFRKTLLPLGFNLGFAIDKTATWYNDEKAYEGLSAELTKIQETLKPKITIYLGNSMGGYGAILYSKTHKPDLVITFGTQIAINKFDKRWDQFWNLLYTSSKTNKRMSVVDCFRDDVAYHLIVGDGEKEDVLHHELIPKKPNITQVVHAGKRHNIALTLKREGKLYDTIKQITKGFLKDNE